MWSQVLGVLACTALALVGTWLFPPVLDLDYTEPKRIAEWEERVHAARLLREWEPRLADPQTPADTREDLERRVLELRRVPAPDAERPGVVDLLPDTRFAWRWGIRETTHYGQIVFTEVLILEAGLIVAVSGATLAWLVRRERRRRAMRE
jgi:hypothetical protein